MTTSRAEHVTQTLDIPPGRPPVLDGRQRWILPTFLTIDYQRGTTEFDGLSDWEATVKVSGQLINSGKPAPNKKDITVTYDGDLPDWVAVDVATYHPAKTD